MSEDQHRTIHAQQAYDFTDVFSYRFSPAEYGKNPVRRLKLMEPDGPSTAGGRQSRQSLVLVPDVDGAGNLVIGWLDVSRKTGEVKTFAAVAQQYQNRYSRSVDIKKDDFDKMLTDLESFLKLQKIQTTKTDAATGPATLGAKDAPIAPGSSVPMTTILMVAAVSAALAFLVAALIFR